MNDQAGDLGWQYAQLEAAFANLPIGVIVFDADQKMVLVNSAYLRTYDLPPGSLERGVSFRDMLQARKEIGTFDGDPDQRAVRFAELLHSDEDDLRYAIEDHRGRSIEIKAVRLAGGGWMSTHEDVTERRRAELERDRSSEFLDFVIDNIPTGLWVKDRAGRYVLTNKRFDDLFGYEGRKHWGETVHDFLPADVAERLDERDEVAWQSGTAGARESTRMLSRNDEVRYIDAIRQPVRSNDGTEYLICAIEDVTERRQAELDRDRNQQFLKFVVDNIPTSVWVKDADGRYLLVNKGYEEMFGFSFEEVEGKTVHQVFPKHLADAMKGRDDATLETLESDAEEPSMVVSHPNGSQYLKAKRQAVRGVDGRNYLICVIEDVTERLQKDEQIAHMANYDQLTDLPNRSLFRSTLDDALAHAGPDDPLAILYLDLDHFKTANDSLGHAVGDQLLAAVASRLRQCVREGDIVARLGGDEFAVILKPRADEPLDAATAARRILAQLRDPFDLNDHRLSIDVSIGIALVPADGREVEELLQNADLALYAAKGAGRGSYRFYEPEMRARVVARQWLEQDLRAALANNEFVLHYQPILDLRSGRIASVETLLRWKHPSKGLVSPAEFVTVAEETRLIIPIGEWVLGQACRDAQMLPDDVRVAVNFSQAQFNSKDLVSRISRAVRDAGLTPDRLELEITESHLIDDHDTAYRRIVRLHEMGFHIAIDDFGTGYSSLQHLATYPFDKLKIDKGFIDQIARSGFARKISESMIGLGVALGMTVTAEGVETEEQLALLKRLGCTEAQGYLICEPRPIEEIIAVIETRPQALAGAG